MAVRRSRRRNLFNLGAFEKLFAIMPVGIAIARAPRPTGLRINATLAKLLDVDVPRASANQLFNLKIPLDRMLREGRPARPEDLAVTQALTTGVTVSELEFDITHRDGSRHSMLAYAAPLYSGRALVGAIGAYFDITDRKRYENTLKFLADASSLLSLSLDPATTLESIARVCVPAFADWCLIDVLGERGALEAAVVFHADPDKVKFARGLARGRKDDWGPARVVRSGQPELFSIVRSDSGRSSNEFLRKLGVRSAIVAPMVARGRAVGAIIFGITQANRRYTARELDAARLLAERASLAFDNARLFQRERRVASSLQRAFLPADLPQVPGVSLDAYYLAGGKESEVGGDWYDAFQLPDGRLCLSVGDVAGRGLRAAVVMGEVRQAFRAAALEGHDPPLVLMRADRLLKLSADSVMVTATFGIFDPTRASFSYSTAGHSPPVLGQPGRGVTILPYEGLPLSVRGDERPAQWDVSLAPGSLLVLYTDGLVEYRRAIVEGEGELLAAVQRVLEVGSAKPASALAGLVLQEQPSDDVAILTLGVAAKPVDRLDMTFPAQPMSAPLVRQALRTLARGISLPEERLFGVELAVGEALNNAITHAYGMSTGRVRLRARTVSGELIVDVIDEGSWRPHGVREHDAEGGRGLNLMRGFVDGVDIVADEASTLVRLRIALGGR